METDYYCRPSEFGHQTQGIVWFSVDSLTVKFDCEVRLTPIPSLSRNWRYRFNSMGDKRRQILEAEQNWRMEENCLEIWNADNYLKDPTEILVEFAICFSWPSSLIIVNLSITLRIRILVQFIVHLPISKSEHSGNVFKSK